MNKKLIRIFNKILKEETLEGFHGSPVPPNKDIGLNNPSEITQGRAEDKYNNGPGGSGAKKLRGAWFTSIPDGEGTAFSYGPYLSTAELDFDNPVVIDYEDNGNNRAGVGKIIKAKPGIKKKFSQASLDGVVNGLKDYPEVDGVIAKNITGDAMNTELARYRDHDWDEKIFDEYIQFDKDDIDIKDTEDNSKLWQVFEEEDEGEDWF